MQITEKLNKFHKILFFMQSTLFLCTWNAGVIHLLHEHFFPENMTSPIFVSHFGHLNLSSTYPFCFLMNSLSGIDVL